MTLKKMLEELQELKLPNNGTVEIYFYGEETSGTLKVCHRDSPVCQGILTITMRKLNLNSSIE